MTPDPLAVFINAPFDPAFDPMLEALVFAIQSSGYRPRCALEENDSGKVLRVITIVRDFLHVSPGGKLLPGPAKLVETFSAFKGQLPDIARGFEHKPDEIGVRTNFRTFVWCITEYLKKVD